jgi:hypothetical protein
MQIVYIFLHFLKNKINILNKIKTSSLFTKKKSYALFIRIFKMMNVIVRNAKNITIIMIMFLARWSLKIKPDKKYTPNQINYQ